MPYHYQDRSEQVQAIGRARHWVERLTQLAHFERVVLRTSVADHDDRRRTLDRRDWPEPQRR